MSYTYLHSACYRNRQSEQELCCDFPGDELFINGLNTMQMHFYNNGSNIQIPIVRVMNTAHHLAAYMFATTCSGDQLEYDALADSSLGRDKRLFKLVIIVLAAMLKRTDGFRAKHCRNMLLENRDEDFDEGVTLYDRFLSSAENQLAEQHFHEEDFQTDIMREMTQMREETIQLRLQNTQLQQQLKQAMDNNQFNQFNAPVYNNCTFNNQSYTTNNYNAPTQLQQDKPEPAEEQQDCPFLVADKLQELNLYTYEEFVQMYRKAAQTNAKELAGFLKKYRDLKVLNLKNLNKKQIYNELKAAFTDDMKFGYPTFAVYF